MRSLFLFLTIFVTLSTLSAAEQKHDAYHWNSLIGKGINLGNALDAPKEGAWGVTLKEAYFELISQAGFDSIRIPVNWANHAAKKAPYTIDPTFLARVDWAVEQALSRDLVVILNIHHYDELYSHPKKNRARFVALWKQLAEHYQNSPATLYFEILNEPHGELTSELWNQYLEQSLTVIRKDKNIIVTFHFYLPFKFTHQGASWVGEQSQNWLSTEWHGSTADKQELIGFFDKAHQWSKTQQRPL
ncbi:MAG: cellulase family glycosylhydrolase [Verrucomicrobiota bacterium]